MTGLRIAVFSQRCANKRLVRAAIATLTRSPHRPAEATRAAHNADGLGRRGRRAAPAPGKPTPLHEDVCGRWPPSLLDAGVHRLSAMVRKLSKMLRCKPSLGSSARSLPLGRAAATPHSGFEPLRLGVLSTMANLRIPYD